MLLVHNLLRVNMYRITYSLYTVMLGFKNHNFLICQQQILLSAAATRKPDMTESFICLIKEGEYPIVINKRTTRYASRPSKNPN